MTIDPRLAERRKTVAEDKAKRNVSRLLKFLVGVVLLGSLTWLVFSPWLSVDEVETSGIEVSSGYSILADQGVVAGTPMIRIDSGDTEAALLEDPWIAEARVDKQWPHGVSVTIVERSPVAWTRTDGGWTRRAVDGVALPSGSEPAGKAPRIDMPELAEVAAGSTPEMLGALEFVDSLPPGLRKGVVVTTRDGELWATVSGYQVRLGRGVEMREKALSLQALLEESVPRGSLLVLIAPTNPAILTPGAKESAKDQVDVSTASGASGDGAETGDGSGQND